MFKSSITPLIFIFITYYYFENFIYIYFIIFVTFLSFNIVFLRIQPLLLIFNLCFLVFVINFVHLRTQSSVPIFHLGARLLAWLLSPHLDTPFSPPGRLCLLPPPSLLYPTLWISLCVLGCGEYSHNWSLAGSVSFLLIPPFILLATSVSFLPLLFFV